MGFGVPVNMRSGAGRGHRLLQTAQAFRLRLDGEMNLIARILPLAGRLVVASNLAAWWASRALAERNWPRFFASWPEPRSPPLPPARPDGQCCLARAMHP